MRIDALTCDCETLGLDCPHTHKNEARKIATQERLECEQESPTRCTCADCKVDTPAALVRWVTRWTITIPLCRDCYTAAGRESEHIREHYAVTHKWHPV